MNIDNKRFRTVENASGLSSGETIFHYFQKGTLITGKYSGGAILAGSIVGKQVGDTGLALLFQCVTTDGELKTGQSTGSVTTNEKGELGLRFDWNWLNGDLSGGTSAYVEITEDKD